MSAVAPMAQNPQPGTAVKAALRSMVWRMTSICSSAEGSGGGSGRERWRRQERGSVTKRR